MAIATGHDKVWGVCECQQAESVEELDTLIDQLTLSTYAMSAEPFDNLREVGRLGGGIAFAVRDHLDLLRLAQ